jgi:NUDIX domain
MPDSLEPGWFQITLKVFLLREAPGGDQLLILKDAEKQIGDLPGGRIAVSELYTPWSDAVRREMSEELGDDLEYELVPEPIFFFAHLVENGGHPAIGFAYRARLKGGTVRLSAEHDWMQWVRLKTYRPDNLFTGHLALAVKRFQTEFA